MVSILKNSLKIVSTGRSVVQQVRFVTRWTSRTPRKVYTNEESEKVESGAAPQKPPNRVLDKYKDVETKWEGATSEEVKFRIRPNTKPLIATHQKSKVMTDMLETVIDENGAFIYTKMKDNDPRVGTILTEIKSKKLKEKQDLALLEGKRLIKEALVAGCHLKYIVFSRKDEVEYLKPFLPKHGLKLYKMPYNEMQLWSDLTTNPGIMGVFKVPNLEEYVPQNPVPITVICDNVREPGNLGAILRIAAAVGCEKLILTKGCVNVWSSKVLRSSAGAHFKLQVHSDVEWGQVADFVKEEAKFLVADNKLISDTEGDVESVKTTLEQIPLLPYYAVDYSPSVVLVVGGETHGISRECYELALKTNGARVNIPLSNDVDSLNVSAALGIIAFEMKKHFVNK